MLQQQRQQQQVGGLGGNSKLSPSHHTPGGVGPKLPGAESLPHAGLSGSVADLHQKPLGPYYSEYMFILQCIICKCINKALNNLS